MKKLLLVVFLLGCAYTLQTDDSATVLVTYDGIGNVVVSASDGGYPQRIGSVTSGLPACLRLPRNTQLISLLVRELGSKDSHVSPQFSTEVYKHWRWELGINLNISRINLTPQDKTCRRQR